MMITICAGLFLVLACIDMGVKQYIEDDFEENEERKTLVSGIVFRKVYNKGFALNILDRHPGIIRKCSLAAMAGIFFSDVRLLLERGKFLERLGMTFASAGAVSNVYDRLARGKVIDYIGLESKNSFFSKLTANLADVYLTAGIVLLALSRIIHKRK